MFHTVQDTTPPEEVYEGVVQDIYAHMMGRRSSSDSGSAQSGSPSIDPWATACSSSTSPPSDSPQRNNKPTL
jgi:hypothetical protein